MGPMTRGAIARFQEDNPMGVNAIGGSPYANKNYGWLFCRNARAPLLPEPPLGRWLGFAALVILAIILLGALWIALKTALSGPTAWLTSAGSVLPHETTLFNFQRVLGFWMRVIRRNYEQEGRRRIALP
jgi:hypothetical protein